MARPEVHPDPSMFFTKERESVSFLCVFMAESPFPSPFPASTCSGGDPWHRRVGASKVLPKGKPSTLDSGSVCVFVGEVGEEQEREEGRGETREESAMGTQKIRKRRRASPLETIKCDGSHQTHPGLCFRRRLFYFFILYQ